MTELVQPTIESQSSVQAVLEGVLHHAEHRARLTAAALEAFEMLPIGKRRKGHRISLPGEFLPELASVMELRCWEQCGIRDHIEAGLPCFADAARELAERAARGPQEFAGSQANSLTKRLFGFWFSRFSWSGVQTLGADLIIQCLDEKELARQIADFVWEYRDCLSQIIDG